ncbi:MAG TPA: transposase [Candidatus Acidoferrales bacterium]
MQHPPRKSLRLSDFDYTLGRVYFLTICTHEWRPIFGDIAGGVLHASKCGTIVSECWFELPYHYARLKLGDFTVMPNHVHGLISLHDPVGAGLRPARRSDSVSEIVRAFKSFSSRRIHAAVANAPKNIWQRGFYDRIVRNSDECSRIRRYIRRNAERWEYDRENSERRKDRDVEEWDS